MVLGLKSRVSGKILRVGRERSSFVQEHSRQIAKERKVTKSNNEREKQTGTNRGRAAKRKKEHRGVTIPASNKNCGG